MFRCNVIGLDANGNDAGNAGRDTADARRDADRRAGSARNMISGNGGPAASPEIGVGILVTGSRQSLAGDSTEQLHRPRPDRSCRPPEQQQGHRSRSDRVVGGTQHGEGNCLSGNADPPAAPASSSAWRLAASSSGQHHRAQRERRRAGNGYSGITVRSTLRRHDRRHRLSAAQHDLGQWIL